MDENNSKSSTVTLFAWFLIIIFAASLPFQIYSSYKDLGMIIEKSYLILLFSLLLTIIYLLPLIFSIGLLRRKNWARLGIMIFALLTIASRFSYMFMIKAFYVQEIIWIIFFLSVFMLLKSNRYSEEFNLSKT